MVYNASLKLLQPDITFINIVIQTQLRSSNNSKLCKAYIIYIFEGNQYLHRELFLKLILKKFNDEDNFTKLCDEFHNKTS